MTTTSLKTIDDESFASEVLAHEGRVLVELTAKWCGPCRQMLPLLHALANERAGTLRVATLDIDDAPRTAVALGVRGAPTFVVFENGREIARQLGAVPPTVLRALVDRPAA